jgi:hypothetical protein
MLDHLAAHVVELKLDQRAVALWGLGKAIQADGMLAFAIRKIPTSID